MRKLWASLIISYLCIAPSGSFATDLHSHSSTYLRFRETASSDNLIPIYQYLDVNIENIKNQEMSFYAGGWGRVDLGDESFTGRTEGDLQYAYLSYHGGPGDNTINLGRFYVFEGVASEQVDGIFARTRLKDGFGVTAYGGLPVETDFDNRGSDYIIGGRISYEHGGLFKIGVSALKSDNDSRQFREEQGIDIWLRPAEMVEVQGHSFYNSLSSGWMEHEYFLTVKPLDKLRLTGDVTYNDYAFYFQSPTLSVFSPLFQNPQETLLAIGGGAEYLLSSRLSAGIDIKGYTYDIMGSATFFGGKLNYTGPKLIRGGLSIHRMDGESDNLSYNQFRFYISKDFGKVDVTVDIFDVNYDRPFSGEDNAFSASVAGGYTLTEKAQVGADFEFSRNPFFDEDLRVFIKFLYQFGEIPWGA